MNRPTSWKDLLDTAIKNIDKKTRVWLFFGVIGMIVNALSTAFLAKSTRPILDQAFIQGKKSALFNACITIFVVFVLKGLSEYINNISMEIGGQRITNALQKKLFTHTMNANFHFFQKTHMGDLSSILINDVRIIKDTILKTFNDAIHHTLLSVLLICLMIHNNPFLTAMCAWILPLIFFLLKQVDQKIRNLSKISSLQSAHLQTFFYEVFHNIILVKSSGTKDKEIAKMNANLDAIEKNIRGLSKVRGAMHPIVEILGGIAIVTSIMIGGWQVVHKEKTVGSFFSFIVSVLFAYPSLKKIAGVRCKIQEGLSSYERFNDIIEKSKTEKENTHTPKKSLKKPKGNIIIENLWFSYPDHEDYVIKDFNATFQEGCFTVLTGPSGSGKTTLFYLLMKLYEPTQGSILWGKDNIKDRNTQTLRNAIGFVSQNSHLFETSIFDNIAYGAQASERAVAQAASKAFAHAFIRKMPDKYRTMIGSDGVQLSGGQSQRIALARAFLKNTPLVLLDESTSALDCASEQKIIQSIEQMKKEGKTIIAIAHKPSIIQHADHIIPMDQVSS